MDPFFWISSPRPPSLCAIGGGITWLPTYFSPFWLAPPHTRRNHRLLSLEDDDDIGDER